MTIRCPNKDCNARMSLPDAVFQDVTAKALCPVCKEVFYPYKLIEHGKPMSPLNMTKEIAEEKTQIIEEKQKATTAGWLIVHDEQAASQTLELKTGVNLIGRMSTGYKPTIKNDFYLKIETQDKTMSRAHFIIQVVDHHGYEHFLLKDAQSTNHTYYDTKRLTQYQREMRELKSEEEIYLEDDAIIMAGQTKIHLRTRQKVATSREATKIISQQKFTKTVIV